MAEGTEAEAGAARHAAGRLFSQPAAGLAALMRPR
jgi:hypothetical protein